MGVRKCKWCGRTFDAGFFLWADEFCSNKCKSESMGPEDTVAQQTLARAAEETARALADLAKTQERVQESRAGDAVQLIEPTAPSLSRLHGIAPMSHDEFLRELRRIESLNAMECIHDEQYERQRAMYEAHIEKMYERQRAMYESHIEKMQALFDELTAKLQTSHESEMEEMKSLYEDHIHQLESDLEQVLDASNNGDDEESDAALAELARSAKPASVADVFERPVAIRNAARRRCSIPAGQVGLIANFFRMLA